jgi:hypothetical protein
MNARCGNEGTQASKEGVGRHLGEGGTGLFWGFEVNADLAVGQALDGIVGKGGTEEIATEAFEAFAVAAVDGDGRVQLHAVGGHEQRDGGRWVFEQGAKRWATQAELDAGSHGVIGRFTVLFEVLGEVFVQAVEHTQ